MITDRALLTIEARLFIGDRRTTINIPGTEGNASSSAIVD